LPQTNSRSLDVQRSLVAGKNAGNLADSAAFRENPSRKHLRIQWLRDKFPTRTSKEAFCASRELIPAFGPEQGIRRKSDPLAATHPIASRRG
jgi:hypothetical protein